MNFSGHKIWLRDEIMTHFHGNTIRSCLLKYFEPFSFHLYFQFCICIIMQSTVTHSFRNGCVQCSFHLKFQIYTYIFSKLLVGVFNKISLNTNSMFTKKITEDHTEIQFFSKKKLIKLFLCTCLAYFKFNFQQRMLLSKRGEK